MSYNQTPSKANSPVGRSQSRRHVAASFSAAHIFLCSARPKHRFRVNYVVYREVTYGWAIRVDGEPGPSDKIGDTDNVDEFTC
jgi:hypothetical protein